MDDNEIIKMLSSVITQLKTMEDRLATLENRNNSVELLELKKFFSKTSILCDLPDESITDGLLLTGSKIRKKSGY